MKSPCTKVCQIDQQTKLCLGCYRTLDEIATWGGMTSGDRERVMAELDLRRPKREAS
ncbi:DUF1289 domain-containing protein [uncultured Roseibium sp.]|uniref:DUF1289 domain-containing protein n=1 Tax=uncultured Roseibium sp. TaxID=1936171 RepID=UPI00321806F6